MSKVGCKRSAAWHWVTIRLAPDVFPGVEGESSTVCRFGGPTVVQRVVVHEKEWKGRERVRRRRESAARAPPGEYIYESDLSDGAFLRGWGSADEVVMACGCLYYTARGRGEVGADVHTATGCA